MVVKLNKKAANAFVEEVKNSLYGILSAWTNTYDCRYDKSDLALRQFKFTARHSFGYNECNWSYLKDELVNTLRELGATSIKHCVEFNYIYLAFNIKPAKYQEICEKLGIGCTNENEEVA
jgi:hypothetical protein